MERINEIERRTKKLEADVDEIWKQLKTGEARLITCEKCNHRIRTRSKSIMISCSSCGSKIQNLTNEEKTKIKERIDKINKRYQKNPEYQKGKDIETTMEDMDF